MKLYQIHLKNRNEMRFLKACFKSNRLLKQALVYEGTTDASFFEGWFEDILIKQLKKLRKCDAIVMDNASFHNKENLTEIAEEHGFKLIFLPPFSPEYNPIEHLWANLKKFLRKNLRNYDSLDKAIDAYFSS